MKKYTIEEIIDWFIRYRRFVTSDSIDNIGQVDFEDELFRFILYVKNNNLR